MKHKTKKIKKDMHLMRVVLAELNKAGFLRRRDLETLTRVHCGTRAIFDRIFSLLKEEGYIQKTSVKHTAPYRITEKGRRFLGIFKNLKENQRNEQRFE